MTATPSARPANPQPLIPPAETMWEKYSPNGEPLLSGLASFTLHAALFGIILCGLWAAFGPTPDPRIVDLPPVTILGPGDNPDAGGGGNPLGVGKERGDLPPPDASRPLPAPGATFEDLPKPDANVKARPPVDDGDDFIDRQIARKLEQNPQLAKIPQLMPRPYQGKPPGQGKNGPGKNGGDGPGDGPGAGSKNKAGIQGDPVRLRRMLRWEMVFTTNDARHYLQQLDALGAVVAVPDRTGKIMTIRNLNERPGRLEYQDIAALKRIYWIDDRPESAESIAAELSLDFTPSAIVAFFPQSLEKELLQKELSYEKRKEQDIALTRFAITFRNGKHVIRVIEQKGK